MNCARLLPKMLQRIYPGGRALVDAERQLENAQARGDVNHSAAMTVRGHKVTRYFSEEAAGKRVAEAVMLNTPQQKYLNLAFEQEKFMRREVGQTLFIM